MKPQEMLERAKFAYTSLQNITLNSVEDHAYAIAVVESRGKGQGHPGHPGWYKELQKQQRDKVGLLSSQRGSSYQKKVMLEFRQSFLPIFENANEAVCDLKESYLSTVEARLRAEPFTREGFEDPQNVAELIAYGGTRLQKREAAIQSEHSRRNSSKYKQATPLDNEQYLSHVRGLAKSWEAFEKSDFGHNCVYSLGQAIAHRGELTLEPSRTIEDLFGYRQQRAAESPTVHVPNQFVSDMFTMYQLEGLRQLTHVYSSALASSAATANTITPQWPGHHVNVAISQRNQSGQVTLPENVTKIILKAAAPTPPPGK